MLCQVCGKEAERPDLVRCNEHRPMYQVMRAERALKEGRRRMEAEMLPMSWVSVSIWFLVLYIAAVSLLTALIGFSLFAQPHLG
jgi:hypothetical protein